MTRAAQSAGSTKRTLIQGVLTAALANGGTVTFSYPAGKNRGHFFNATDHQFVAAGSTFQYVADFELSYSATLITLTSRIATTIPAGSVITLGLNELSGGIVYAGDDPVASGLIGGAKRGGLVIVNFGSPVAADADSAALAQAVGAAGNLTLAGVLATAGLVVFDVPRAVQMVSTNVGDTTQTATITGKDVYGNAMVEVKTFNGTTVVQGLKAFKSISQIAISAALTGNASVGHNDVLGIPIFIPSVTHPVHTAVDGVWAAGVTGTAVAGIIAKPTGTNGDVRGTFDPTTACNGSVQFMLGIYAPQISGGAPQFTA